MDELRQLLPFLVPILLIQLGLQIWALVDLIRRPRVQGLPRLVWGLIIVFGQIIRPVIYLLAGRVEE